MDKCLLCQQLKNNLTKVFSNRIKSFARMILKMKGFKDTLDNKNYFKICQNCIKSIENVALFWEKIPEAKQGAAVSATMHEELDEREPEIITAAPQRSLPAITSISVSERANSNPEQNLGPIKIRIKLPRKRKRERSRAVSTSSTQESAQKRIRRCPKRYEDFDFTTSSQVTNLNKKVVAASNKCSETCLNNADQVAVLRSTNGQVIGKLVEVHGSESARRLRIFCEICREMFYLEKHFQQHFVTHYVETQTEQSECIPKSFSYYCILCNKSFSMHYAVRRHFRGVHSEERPLKCQYCEASFKYKFNLDYHMARHVPGKRFECAFCKAKFLKRYELQIHVRTHTKEKPYNCEFCSFACAHRSNLKSHQNKKHMENSTNQNSIKANVEKFTPPLELVEDEKYVLRSLKDHEVSELELTAAVVQQDENGLNAQNIELNCSKPETLFENTPITTAKQFSTKDNNILGVSKSSEALKENLISQSKFGTLNLDFSILKALSSSTLLELKKWPKSFQGKPEEEPIKSVIKYIPPQKDSCVKSMEIARDKAKLNISDTIQSLVSCTSTIESTKSTNNFEVCAASGAEFINISELSKDSTAQKQNEYFDNINEVATMVCSSDVPSEYFSNETNNVQTHNVIKGVAKPVKVKSIVNLKTSESKAIESLSGASYASSGTRVNSSFETPTKSTEICNKITHFSERSLLKPITTAKQITSLSLTSSSERSTVLAAKPIITNVEILPSVNTLEFLPNTPATSLIKPLNDFKHQCGYCYKYFKQKSALTKHIRTHTGEKPYKCSLCPKSYGDASNYKKHRMLHKNAAEALNISRTPAYVVQNSPAYSTVSDPDPDGIEVMQTLNKFEYSSNEDNDVADADDASNCSSVDSHNVWEYLLEHVLNNNEIKENLKRNFPGISNDILPKNMHQTVAKNSNLNKNFSTEDPD